MKATINENGVLTVSAENSLEAYALGKWGDSAVIIERDEKRNESAFVRGSHFIIDTDVHRVAPRGDN